MSSTNPSGSAPFDPELIRLASGYMPAFLLGAALRIGVPDAIGDATVPVTELARATSTHEASLQRMLRALAAIEVVAEEAPGEFRLTRRGELLRTDVPGSLHGTLTVLLDESMWSSWPALDHAVRTGKPAFEHVHGTDYMTHIGWDERPRLREYVDQDMLAETRSIAPSVLDAFDFAPFTTVVDVGGGSGPLVAAVLAAHPHLRGTVFDQPDGVALTSEVLREAGVEDRCDIRTGSFFSSVPKADLYLCKSVIFNWADDDDVAALLGSVRAAIAADGRLLMVEQMLPATVDGSVPANLYVDDLNSIVSLGGRLRTVAEYDALLTAAGFTWTVHRLPTAHSGYSLLEAAPR